MTPNRCAHLSARIAFAAILVGLDAGTSSAQESAARPDSRPNQELLNQAVAGMLDVKGFHMTAEATTRTPDNAMSGGGGFGGGGAVRVFSASAGGGDTMSFGMGGSFTGSFEVLRTPKSELLLSSKLALPGWAVLKIGDRSLTSRTYETEGPDPSSLRRELMPLLDPALLMPALKAATATLGRDVATGGDLWRVTLPVSLIEPKVEPKPEPKVDPKADAKADPKSTARARPPMRFGGIKRLEAIFIVDKSGTVTGCQFIVTREDPMAGFRRSVTTDGGGGTFVIGRTPDGDDPPADAPEPEHDGPSNIYTLKPTASSPSPRADRMIEHLRDLIPAGK